MKRRRAWQLARWLPLSSGVVLGVGLGVSIFVWIVPGSVGWLVGVPMFGVTLGGLGTGLMYWLGSGLWRVGGEERPLVGGDETSSSQASSLGTSEEFSFGLPRQNNPSQSVFDTEKDEEGREERKKQRNAWALSTIEGQSFSTGSESVVSPSEMRIQRDVDWSETSFKQDKRLLYETKQRGDELATKQCFRELVLKYHQDKHGTEHQALAKRYTQELIGVWKGLEVVDVEEYEWTTVEELWELVKKLNRDREAINRERIALIIQDRQDLAKYTGEIKEMRKELREQDKQFEKKLEEKLKESKREAEKKLEEKLKEEEREAEKKLEEKLKEEEREAEKKLEEKLEESKREAEKKLEKQKEDFCEFMKQSLAKQEETFNKRFEAFERRGALAPEQPHREQGEENAQTSVLSQEKELQTETQPGPQALGGGTSYERPVNLGLEGSVSTQTCRNEDTLNRGQGSSEGEKREEEVSQGMENKN